MTMKIYLDSVTSASTWVTDGTILLRSLQAITNSASLTAGSTTDTIPLNTARKIKFTGESGFPNIVDWPAGSVGDEYQAVVNISAIGADIILSSTGTNFPIIHINSAATSWIDQVDSGSWDSNSGTGLHTWTENNTFDPVSASSADRVGSYIRISNSSTMKNQDITFGWGTTSVYLQGPWGAAPATTLRGYAQAKAQIKATGVEGVGQAQTRIKQIYQGYGQAQARVKQVYQGYAQAQAVIRIVDFGFGQTQARIKAIGRGFSQSQAEIKQTYFSHAQAQATIAGGSTTLQSYAQGQARIKQTYQGYAQAQAQIKQVYQGYSQAQARVKQTYNSFAQAQSSLSVVSRSYSQAQALIYLAQELRPIQDITTNGIVGVII